MSDKFFIQHDNKVTIINDDVLYTENVQDDSIDLIITSPPYNVDIKYNSHKDDISYHDYLEFSKKWMTRCYNWLKNDGRFCLNVPLDKNKGGQQSVGADFTTIAKNIGFHYHSTIIWNEGNISRRTAWGSFKSASAPFVIAPVELIIVLYKQNWKKQSGTKNSDISKENFMNWTNGLWTFSGESKKKIGHPAPFPVELPKRCIQLFSYVNDVILDPFLGSGSTLIAAYKLNRIGIGIDIDRKYCKIALERLRKEGGLGQFRLDSYYKSLNKQKIKPTSHYDIILEFFKENPWRNITYAEMSNFIENDYFKKSGLKIKYFEKCMRDLADKGKIKKVDKGVFRYEPHILPKN